LTDAELRAYLLGQAPEAAATRLEERLIEDEGVFAALRVAEDDLFDDYVRGRLSLEDRARFADRYRGEPKRLAFARALARRTAPPALRGYWMPMALAATVVIAFGALLLTRVPPATQVTSAPPASEPAVPATTTIVATLVLGTTRSAGAVPEILVPASAAFVELRVRLNPADRYPQYAAELRSSANEVAWQAGGLAAVADAGELVVAVRVPAAGLTQGLYELAIQGAGPNRVPEMLGFVTVQVSRTP
jgi:hypothetical protein